MIAALLRFVWGPLVIKTLKHVSSTKPFWSKLLGVFRNYCGKHLLPWSCPSVLLSVRLSTCTARLPLDGCRGNTGNFSEKLGRNTKFGSNRVKISGTLHEDVCMFYCSRRHKISIKALSSSEMVSGCWDSWGGTNIMRTWNKTMLYVHCLSCCRVKCKYFRYVSVWQW
jgi:hypothetical protein